MPARSRTLRTTLMARLLVLFVLIGSVPVVAVPSGAVPPSEAVPPSGAVQLSDDDRDEVERGREDVLPASAEPLLLQQQEPRYASAAEIEALEVQAGQLDEMVEERPGRGEPVSDALGRELTEVFGEIARFREIQRRHADAGGEGTGVDRAEVDALADRIAALRVRIRGHAAEEPGIPGDPAAAGPAGPAGAGAERGPEARAEPPRTVDVPEGTRVIIELEGWLSSDDAEVGDRFEATATDDVLVDGRVAIPRDTLFEGYVAAVERARRASRGGALTLIVDRVYDDPDSPTAVRATVVGAAYGADLEGEDVDTDRAVRRGILGAVIGGLIGGGKGALIGLGIGSGGTLLAEKGEEVDLPPGTRLRVRFETSVAVTWRPVGSRR